MKRVLPTLFMLLALLVPARALAVKINEFVANANPEWVEFFNDDLTNEVLMTYWLDDDADFVSDTGSSTKLSLGGLNTSNPLYPFITMSQMLNNGGDSLVLFDAEGNVVDQFSYSADPGPGVAVGRNPDGTGNFEVLSSTSQGAPNFPSPTEVPPTPTLEPTPEPTAEPTPTDVPPTPTLAPTPTVAPSPTGAPQEEVLDAGIFTCRITYSPKTLFGLLIWWPKLSCEKNIGD